MSVNIKNTVITITLIAVTIPFILVTDIFPFLRFGMFAEPIKTNIQKEIFIITYKNNQGKEQLFDPKKAGIEQHLFYYLVRNYYYRNESPILIKNIEKIYPTKGIKCWNIKRILISDSINIPSDTIVVYTEEK